MRPHILFAPLILFAAAPSLFARDCKVNGKDVNPDNGNTTEGLTGIMICRESPGGPIVREQELVKGSFLGHDMMFNFQGEKIVRRVNAQGNTDGRRQTWNEKGVLIADEMFANGERQGISKTYYPSGKLERIGFYEKDRDVTVVTYSESGQLTDLTCGAKQAIPQDREWCGYTAKRDAVVLYDSQGRMRTSVLYADGKRTEMKSKDENGTVREDVSAATSGPHVVKRFDAKGRLERETNFNGRDRDGIQKFFNPETGSVLNEIHWSKNATVKALSFYMNGQVKRATKREGTQKDPIYRFQSYDSKGRVEQTGAWKPYSYSRWPGEEPDSWEGGKREGAWQTFNEKGVLIDESNYKDGDREGLQRRHNDAGLIVEEETYVKDVLQRRRSFDEAGKLSRDEQFFPDGSSKAVALPMKEL